VESLIELSPDVEDDRVQVGFGDLLGAVTDGVVGRFVMS
jgi:hypothetical protein